VRSCCPTHALPEIHVADESPNLCRQRSCIADRHENARGLVRDDLAGPTGIGGHDRAAPGGRLEQGVGKSLPVRRLDDDVEGRDDPPGVGHGPVEPHALADSQLPDLAFEHRAQWSLSNQDETGTRAASDGRREGFHQEIVPLHRQEIRDTADRNVVICDGELSTNRTADGIGRFGNGLDAVVDHAHFARVHAMVRDGVPSRLM
jgi:hypothetical protein